jgi:hypothetical protein
VDPIKEVSPAGVVFALGGGPAIEVELPIIWSFLNGGAGSYGYNSLSIQGASTIGVGEFTCGEVRLTIADYCLLDETVRLHRHVQANPGPDAINLALNAAIEFDDSRPLVPGMIYSPRRAPCTDGKSCTVPFLADCAVARLMGGVDLPAAPDASSKRSRAVRPRAVTMSCQPQPA